MSVEKARLRVLKFRQREQSILDATLSLLLEHGEDNVTVETIADKVDIGKGTVYKHFTSKSELYTRLLYDYELALKEQMEAAIETAKTGDDYAAPAKAYFFNRISDPHKARLFQRLEEKLSADPNEKIRLEELGVLRKSVFDKLNIFFESRIQAGELDDVPPYYYYLSYWALTQGAVELFHSTSFNKPIQNMPELMNFIMDVGVKIGRSPNKDSQT